MFRVSRCRTQSSQSFLRSFAGITSQADYIVRVHSFDKRANVNAVRERQLCSGAQLDLTGVRRVHSHLYKVRINCKAVDCRPAAVLLRMVTLELRGLRTRVHAAASCLQANGFAHRSTPGLRVGLFTWGRGWSARWVTPGTGGDRGGGWTESRTGVSPVHTPSLPQSRPSAQGRSASLQAWSSQSTAGHAALAVGPGAQFDPRAALGQGSVPSQQPHERATGSRAATSASSSVHRRIVPPRAPLSRYRSLSEHAPVAGSTASPHELPQTERRPAGDDDGRTGR